MTDYSLSGCEPYSSLKQEDGLCDSLIIIVDDKAVILFSIYTTFLSYLPRLTFIGTEQSYHHSYVREATQKNIGVHEAGTRSFVQAKSVVVAWEA